MARTSHSTFFNKVKKHEVLPTLQLANKQIELAGTKFFYLTYNKELSPEVTKLIQKAKDKITEAETAVRDALKTYVSELSEKGEL